MSYLQLSVVLTIALLLIKAITAVSQTVTVIILIIALVLALLSGNVAWPAFRRRSAPPA